MTEGKRLLLTALTQVLCAGLIALNTWLGLNLSTEVLTALSVVMGTNAIAYIWGQSKTDIEEKKEIKP